MNGAVRRGSVLILVLLGLLLLELMILGSLAIAANGATLAGLAGRRLHARLVAESAVRESVASTDTALASAAPGTVTRRAATFVDGGVAELEILAPGRILVRGYAPAAGTDRNLAQALIGVLPIDSLRSLFDAALHTAAPVRIAATASIDGTAASSGGACDAPPEAGVSSPAGSVALEPGAAVAGSPPIVERLLPSARGLAGIPFPSLRPLASHEVTGTVTPGPGPCDGSDPLDWGDPAPESACHGHIPLIAAPADLTIAGGSGQGLLLVLGRLRMTSGARFDGAIIARSVDLADATVTGAIRTFGDDTSAISGTIHHDACALERVFLAPALRRPFQHGPRLWLPAR